MILQIERNPFSLEYPDEKELKIMEILGIDPKYLIEGTTNF